MPANLQPREGTETPLLLEQEHRIVQVVPTPPPPARMHEVSAIGISPIEQRNLERHNDRIGLPLQRAVMHFILLYVVGPPAWLAIHLLFRVRVDNAKRFDVLCKGSGIFAVRHFFEIDPLVSFYAAAWTRAVRFPQLAAFSLASRAWTRSRPMRAVSWLLGVMGLSRGLGARQSATSRAVELLRSGRKTCAIIFPTGPIGRRATYTVGPGVGYLAEACPDLPVLPVTVKGLQEFRWRDLLLLRRPHLRIAVCRPFYAGDLPEPSEAWRIDRVCDLVAERWTEEEARMAAEP